MSKIIIGRIETTKIQPVLEDLVVTPSKEEQNFESANDGYDKVKVKAINTESLVATPTLKEQIFEGMYDKVTVTPIEGENLVIEPKQQLQQFSGVYKNVTVNEIKGDTLNITPTTQKQAYEGLYEKVNVNPITENTLNVAPKASDQSFNGVYTKVNVDAITGDTLNVTPSTQEQNFEGLYSNVNVNPITGDTLNITPTTSEQTHEGVYTKVNVEPITGEEITITPCATEQVKEGLYSKVTVTGDSNLVAENIAKDVTIFGVQGTHEGGGESEYNATLKVPSGSIRYGTIASMYAIGTINCKGFTDLDGAFKNHTNLTKIEGLINTSGVTSTSETYYSCQKLESAPNIDTSSVTNMSSMYAYSKVKVIPEHNASKCKNVYLMFGSCSSITTFGGLTNLGQAYTQQTANYSNYKLDLNTNKNITHDSLMNVINKLYDLNLTYNVANGGTLYTQQLVLGSYNLTKLTADEIAIATAKGFSVS